MMKKNPLGRGGMVLLGLAVIAMAPLGCELIASVDRNLIEGTGGTGTGGTGAGGGTGGGTYQNSGFIERPDQKWQYEYAKVHFPRVNGAENNSMGIDFQWSDATSQPIPLDLSVKLSGVEGPLVQVFSIDDSPFVRADTHVEPLEADTQYRVEVTRTSTAVWAQVVLEDGTIVVSGPVSEIDPIGDDMLTIATAKNDPRVQLGAVKAWRGVHTE